MSPEGITFVGRWHGMQGGGVAGAETGDPKALYAGLAEWSDVIPLKITPRLEDADAGEVLASVKG